MPRCPPLFLPCPPITVPPPPPPPLSTPPHCTPSSTLLCPLFLSLLLIYSSPLLPSSPPPKSLSHRRVTATRNRGCTQLETRASPPTTPPLLSCFTVSSSLPFFFLSPFSLFSFSQVFHAGLETRQRISTQFSCRPSLTFPSLPPSPLSSRSSLAPTPPSTSSLPHTPPLFTPRPPSLGLLPLTVHLVLLHNQRLIFHMTAPPVGELL